jgi:amidase
LQRAARDRIAYGFDRHREPVLRVAPGEHFRLETEDSRAGRTRTPEACRPEALRALRAKGLPGNPVTGPVYVETAGPGDTLAVDLHAVEPDTLGYFGHWPFLYHLSDWITEPVTGLVAIRDGHVEYTLQTASGPHEVRIPLRPMAGCIGVAPDLAVPTTSDAGRYGGNLDVPEVCAGSTVYLPVLVPGAFLYAGDCHPYQGDGEVSGCEMRAELELSVRVLKGGPRPAYGPRIETATHLVAVGADRPAESAQWLAVREMILWLGERHGWTKAEARDFLALVGDLRPGQVQAGPYTMRLIVPKAMLPPG